MGGHQLTQIHKINLMPNVYTQTHTKPRICIKMIFARMDFVFMTAQRCGEHDDDIVQFIIVLQILIYTQAHTCMRACKQNKLLH